eukprot:CAMPEP_0183299462 /NCGR_PEP_ID=MMETSP0160_2-20130417/6198_1 /TAXON_ID=2839 ORGANISM="Odontella Sinensis, Strain Grunow 1884" /NCGR_SAMPLE_ID=MMETSP0160_2 /ASSEMBLY_ACC=CAM_ASM_000250 /LENGTH=303 /DNA_ID=CAMNT_0025461717 /DNA_START=261 /DNA_END=1172 /DNA_ORIENTATION=-
MIPTQCPRNKRRRVIDMTLINNELAILELRLNELWNVVDFFFIVESTVPFKPDAAPKRLYLTDHWRDFSKFHSKMILHVIPPNISQHTGAKVDKKDYGKNFGIRTAQREEMWRVMKEKLYPGEEDLIIGADLDEIPRPSVLEKLACDPPGVLPKTPICLQTKDSFYYYNYKCHIKFEWKDRPKVLHRHDDQESTCRTHIVNGSTHCSSCFSSLADYHIKSISNAEPIQHDDMQTNNASVIERVQNCRDFWLRSRLDSKMELRDSVDLGSVPLIVTRHPERWPHLMGKGPLYEDVTPENQSWTH